MNPLRRLFLAAPFALAAFAGQAQAQELSLSEISSYLNQLQTAQGDFTQINSDGTISTGTIYIKRPGRIRFEYDAPEKSLVIAGGGSVAIFDARSTDNPQRYPLSETPLSIILQDNVDLTRASMVTGHSSDGTSTTVTAQDPAHPEYGNIQLKFTNPTQLRQWVITDNTGTQTTMVLGDMTIGGGISDRMFNIIAETDNWN